MTVAYLGAPGAFSHEACLLFLPDQEPVGRDSFEEVIAAVSSKETEFGMLPLFNNEAGETGARELIASSGLRILEERIMPLRMQLMALPGVHLDEVRTVVSHPVALRQCARTLAGMGLDTEEANDTAGAAAALKDRSQAALASEAAARTYGLTILKADVHDRPDNATYFAIVARGCE